MKEINKKDVLKAFQAFVNIVRFLNGMKHWLTAKHKNKHEKLKFIYFQVYAMKLWLQSAIKLNPEAF